MSGYGHRSEARAPGSAIWVSYGVCTTGPPGFATKTAGRLMGEAPLLTPAQMELWEWMAEYYMCTLGDVMRFAMPAALKPAG